MAALGLQNYWEKRFLTKPKCEGNFDKGIAKPRLTMSNLFGAFLLLVVGIGISFLVFIFENVSHLYKKPGDVIKKA